jgi:lipid II:glycine glycyltransferase (peptidoglycan interpeptide bridge formation enzyme)
LIARFSRSRGVSVPAPGVLECFLRLKILERGEGIALCLRYQGRTVAGIVVIGCGKRAIFSYSFRQESAKTGNMPLTHILHYRAICWALENGYSCYDFGGYDEEHENNTNNRFKLGFSRRIETVSENYIYSFHPGMTMLFNLLGRIRSRLSLG